MGIKTFLLHAKDRYTAFVEHQGFPIIVTVCVAVITATAVWTGSRQESYVSPTPPAADHISAAQLLQQSLKEAATPTPAPTETPRRWQAPLRNITVLQAYDAKKMILNSTTGIWAIHDAVDLQCSPGEKILAMSDGIVLASGNDKLNGAWLLIDHGDGIEALYAGMAVTGAYIPGDEVRMGSAIGYAGHGPADETDLSSHLHLRITQNGHSIDPFTLW